MAINIQLKNDAKTTLSAGISAADLSATLVNGGLFPALAGSQYFIATLQDSSGNREIVKATARTGNVVTIDRGQESTTPRSFASGSLFQLRLTEGSLSSKIDEELADGPTIGADGTGATAVDFNPVNNKVIAQATAPTITATSERILALTPAGAITQALPTGATILQGTCIRIVNLASVAGRNITINSSGGNLVWLVCPGNHCVVMSTQDNPTTAAHWAVIERGWPIHARVHKSADQTNITEDTATKVTFDTTLADPALIFVDATDRFLFPIGGWWELQGEAAYSGGRLDGTTGQAIGFYLNGAETAGGGVGNIGNTAAPNGTAQWSFHVSARIFVSSPGVDYAELFFTYGDTTATNTGDLMAAGFSTMFESNKATWMSARWLSP